MDNINTETGQEVLDEETTKILDNLEKEGHQVNRPDKPASPEPKEEEKPNEPPKEEDNPPETPPEEKPKEEPIKRDVTMVEAYKLKIAEDQKASLEKREQELLSELEKYKSPTDTQKPNADENVQAKEFAEKHNVSDELALDIIRMTNSNRAIPAEIEQKLKEFDELKEENRKNKAIADYNNSFEKQILPLVKEEYPDMSEEKLSQLKDHLFDLAHSESYATTELDVIYRGKTDFREWVAPKKPSAETSRGGSQRGVDEVDFENVTEADIDKMDRETFDKYSNYMAKKEKGEV